MKCDSRTIGREYSEEFDEVTADLNEFKLEEIERSPNVWQNTIFWNSFILIWFALVALTLTTLHHSFSGML